MVGAPSITPLAKDHQSRGGEAWWLMGMLALGTAAVLLYSAYMSVGTGRPLSQSAEYLLMIVVILGSPFGPRLSEIVGLPVSPALKEYLAGENVHRLMLAATLRGLALGVLVIPLILGEQRLWTKLLHSPPVVGLHFTPKKWMTPNLFIGIVFLSSIGAPLFEEITLRVFVFAFFAWLIGKMRGLRGRQGFAVLMVANVAQALIAGLGHVLGGATGLPIGPWYLQVLISPQTLGSFALGCIYWRYGLETSMLSHFWGNFIGNVVPIWLFYHPLW